MDKTHCITLAELARLTGAQVVGDPAYVVSGYADLDSATERDVAFLSNPRYTPTRYATAMRQSRAGGIFVASHIPRVEGKHYLVHPDPSRAFQQAIECIWAKDHKASHFEGIHPTAVVHETVRLGVQVALGPHAVVEADTCIGDGTYIGAGTYIGPRCTLGEGCLIQPNVVVREACRIGHRVTIQSGSVIGSWGFGYATDAQGVHTRISQLGIVAIEDDVEIGSNVVVDRARFTETRIGQGTKIDSGVIVGHNVRIGKHTLICGQTAIAGSTEIGNHVVVAGQCGIDGHLKIGDRVLLAARSGVTKSLAAGKYAGYPARPLEEHHKNTVLGMRMSDYADKIKELEERLKALEKSS